MQKLLDLLKTIPNDKLLHFFFGSVIFYLSLLLLPELYAIISSLIIFAAKEVYDKVSKKGNCDIIDFIFSALPIVLYLTTKL